jgi:hypothetical protein
VTITPWWEESELDHRRRRAVTTLFITPIARTTCVKNIFAFE